jgi:hypothetical protein
MTPVMPIDDALIRLQQSPLGKATYVRVQTDTGHWETVWLVRDEARHLASLGPTPAVEFRAGAFDEGGVVVLPILVHLGQVEQVCLYDTYLNAYQIEGENVYLQDLARQDRLHLHLYDESAQLVRTLTAANTLDDFARGVLERQAAYQPATEAAFAYACERLSANHADILGLWQTLGAR